MAPIDRQERRLQKRRGAGPTNVVANFAFDIASLAANATAKQTSLPPQSSRRIPTPVNRTPRGVNSSAKRHRSVSVHRSGSVKPRATPKSFATPQLGKRKRGSKDAQALRDDGEPDELSPDRQDSQVHSVERVRRVVGTISPDREEVEKEVSELLDELSGLLDEDGGSAKKPTLRTPARSDVETPLSRASARERRSGSGKLTTLSLRSRSSARRSKSTEAPETPGATVNGQTNASISDIQTPSMVPPEEEDELTPAQNSSTPRVIEQTIIEEDLDELSPEQPTSIKNTPKPLPREDDLDELSPEHTDIAKSNGRAKSIQRKKPKRTAPEPDIAQSTPITSKAGRKRPTNANAGSAEPEDVDELSPEADRSRKQIKRKSVTEPAVEDESVDSPDSLDELSPEPNRTQKQAQLVKPTQQQDEVIDISSAEESDDDEVEHQERTMPVSPIAKPKPVKKFSAQPPRKRAKLSGLKQAISVMRLGKSTVGGVSVADTTRTILEEHIDHLVQRMAEKLQTADSSRRKRLRTEANLTLAFKESLSEKLVDLQDANDSLSANFKKRRRLRHSNVERRKEILQAQNNRHEIALEMDEERAAFDAVKAKMEAKSKLSASLFEVQAAVRSGRERARREGREDEGPERPLSMLIETVGRQVGSAGGGLLSSVQRFNKGLEKAAGWLEGRA